MRSIPRCRGAVPIVLMVVVVAGLSRRADRAGAGDGISLMQTLAPWSYPGAELPGGATMSDAGTPPVRAVRCGATMTTADPFDKVVAHYAAKLGPAAARSVSVQDDSEGRPASVRVVTVNTAETATTLVISRAKGEGRTHIVWSHYRRIGP